MSPAGTSDGFSALSLVKAVRPKDWSRLEEAFKNSATVAGQVAEVIKGGVRVDIGVRAFMPASRSGARDQAEMEQLVGQEIQCRIIQLDTANEDVVVDRRVILDEEAKKRQRELFESIQEGETRKGIVRRLTGFGAFVDIGGVEGLLHVSDIAWHRVAKPADVLHDGEEIEVKVLRVDPAKRKVSLSRKALIPDPWTATLANLNVGDRITGKVARLADFGAFVEITPGVEGLIHLSEMSWSKRIRKPSDVVNEGEMVQAQVLAINAADRRIGLGLKQVLGDPWQDAAGKYPVGAVVEGPVVSLVDFGAFVSLEEGVDGMIHIADIAGDKRIDHPKEVLKVGEVVKAKVLEVDGKRRRMRLGMKQLEPTAWDRFIAEHSVGEEVTGRVMEAGRARGKVDLGEGVRATLIIKEEAASEPAPAARKGADIRELTSMLAARWKEGGSLGSQQQEGPRTGEVRRVRIRLLDPEQNRIEVELAD